MSLKHSGDDGLLMNKIGTLAKKLEFYIDVTYPVIPDRAVLDYLGKIKANQKTGQGRQNGIWD